MTSTTTEPRSGIALTHSTPSNKSAASPTTAQSQDRRVLNYDALKLVFSLFIPPLAEGDLPGLPLAIEGTKQLCALSKVCTAFQEPALDCLWYNLPGLGPLLKLHPALRVIDGAYCPQQVDAAKIGKFETFSRRVRGIRLGEGPNAPLPIAFASYAWLGQQRNTLPLLPALRQIYFEGPGGNTQHLGLLSLILSPLIQEVQFQGALIFNETFTSCTLPLVCTGADAMQRLSFEDSSAGGYEPIWDAFTRVSRPLPINTLNIRFPENPTMQPSFVGQLASKFTMLTSLTLDVHTPSHVASNKVLAKAFPALSSLHLINRAHTKICRCYPRGLVQRATSITLYVTSNVADVDAFKETLDTLSTIQPLKRVRIEQSYPSHEVSILALAIHPFLQRLNLEELHLGIWGLDPGANNPHGQQAMKALADASVPADGGSKLRSLRLPLRRRAVYYTYNAGRHSYNVPQANYPPIGSLIYFAQQASTLHHLALSIDSSAAEENGEMFKFKSFAATWAPKTISSLRHLELADMRSPSVPSLTGAQCKDLALLLDAIFPNLELLSVVKTPERNTAWDEQWDAIDEIRRSFKELRLYRSGRI